LFRPVLVYIAGIIGKEVRAEGRNPDYVGFWIVCPLSGIIILKVFFPRIDVFKRNEPATGTTFFYTSYFVLFMSKRNKK
jgi:hypothetical protein